MSVGCKLAVLGGGDDERCIEVLVVVERLRAEPGPIQIIVRSLIEKLAVLILLVMRVTSMRERAAILLPLRPTRRADKIDPTRGKKAA